MGLNINLSRRDTPVPPPFMPNQHRPSTAWTDFPSHVTFRATRLLTPDHRDLVSACLQRERQMGTRIIAFVIMPDHVHLLIQENDLSNSLKRIKGVSARDCNKFSGWNGSLWQADNFIEIIKTSDQYATVLAYIVANPVKAGMSTRVDDYKWLWRE